MPFFADDLGAWLIGLLADTGRKKLITLVLGTEQERALRSAAAAAVRETALELSPDDDVQAKRVSLMISQVFSQPLSEVPVAKHQTMLEALRAGIAAQLAVLYDAGTGQSSADMLIPGTVLAETLTGHLLKEILVQGSRGGPLFPLASELNDNLTHLRGLRLEGMIGRLAEDVQRALSQLDVARTAVAAPTPLVQLPLPMTAFTEGEDEKAALAEPRSRSGDDIGFLRQIEELDNPFVLEVHRAIDINGLQPGGLEALPRYVRREHDRRLADVVATAVSGHSAIAVLVGESSSGKTRACWEAIRAEGALPAGWRLWHPIYPGRPQALLAGLTEIPPCTVLWLNETQDYLLTPGSEVGEQAAAGLRELLREPNRGPVLVLGTLWPNFFHALTRRPPADEPDLHPHAREMLDGKEILVPAAFTGAALEAVDLAAAQDPRLTEAVARAEDGQITQFLAGAPELLRVYGTAPPAANALITAAIDVRRLGHGPALPQAVLTAAAPGYLTDWQWDQLPENWIEAALAYCAVSCRGARGPLTLVRPRPGRVVDPQPVYRLADYLEHSGRIQRATTHIPAETWDALVEYAPPANRMALGFTAQQRGLYRYALRLYTSTGNPYDHHEAAVMLGLLGRPDEALDYFKHAGDARHPLAYINAVLMLNASPRRTEIDRLVLSMNPHDPTEIARVALRALNLGYKQKWSECSWRARAVKKSLAARPTNGKAGNSEPIDTAGGRSSITTTTGGPSPPAIIELAAAGLYEEALQLCWHRADDGSSPMVLAMAAGILRMAGREEDAKQLEQYGREPDGSIAAPWTASELDP